MKRTIGGNRLRAGNLMRVDLKNYGSSTHNLSRQWKSSAAPGVLIPCFGDVVLPGDKWKIKIDTKVFTYPTRGPLFGSFKYQIDMFYAPYRLYNGALHNNMLGIGMEMNKILLPRIMWRSSTRTKAPNDYIEGWDNADFAPTSLNAYLGIRSLESSSTPSYNMIRNATRWIMYFDIFKNAYANKQEENAYQMQPVLVKAGITRLQEQLTGGTFVNITKYGTTPNNMADRIIFYADAGGNPEWTGSKLMIHGINLTGENVQIKIVKKNAMTDTPTVVGTYTISQIAQPGSIILNSDHTKMSFYPQLDETMLTKQNSGLTGTYTYSLMWTEISGTTTQETRCEMVAFPLKNIDTMRNRILGINDGTSIVISTRGNTGNDINIAPYVCNVETKGGQTGNQYLAHDAMCGLMCKTYQADIFNAWLSKAFVESIANASNVDVSSGTLSMDSLLVAQKVFNIKTNIALAGGTLNDWRTASYGVEALTGIETPLFIGGLSTEIIFQEVVSNAATNENQAGSKPLGTLAGRGTTSGKKGGYVELNVKEEGEILGIMSITPRLDYCQGNDWQLYLFNMGQLHIPELDGIGFQDLMQEQMAGWANFYRNSTTVERPAIGKLPAWIDYQTSFNKALGDFADENKANFMVLSRDYEPTAPDQNAVAHTIADATTYINPRKYNKIFADTSMEAQNFWCLINFDVTVRRKMSANPIQRF